MRSRKSLRAEQQLGLVFDAPGLVAGVDEAGRGPLAGPVVAAAVILDELKPIRGLNDSKLLTPRTRERLFDEIHAKALCFCIAQAAFEWLDDPARCDALRLRFEALHRDLRRNTAEAATDAIEKVLAG